MHARRWLAAVVACLSAGAGWAADEKPAPPADAVNVEATSESDEKPDPRSKLETAIPEAIRLLDEREHREFLRLFVEPKELEEITERTPFDQFADGFAAEKADDLLKVLKAIQDAEPKLDPEKNTATYPFEVRGVRKKSITFVRVEKLWRIRND